MSALIVVNRPTQQLTLWRKPFARKRFHLQLTYTISTGVAGLETPAGHYFISEMIRHPTYTYPYSDWVPVDLRGVTIPAGSPENPIVGRWMSLDSDDPDTEPLIAGIGIHGSRDKEDLGTPASHGCVRMSKGDVMDLFNRVSMDTVVIII